MTRRTFALFLFFGCQGAPESDPQPIEPAPPAAVEPAGPEVEQGVETPPAPLPPPTGERYAASHILVTHAEAVGSASRSERSREEAETLARGLHERAVSGEAFAKLAREHSEGPSAPRGGRLGTFVTRTMVPEFEAAVASVEVGAIAPLIETPFGFHVIRRDAVRRARGRHILVEWRGSWRSRSERSEDEAKERAFTALEAIRGGRPFGEVAREYSDEPVVDATGGELGWVAPGQLIPGFEDALFDLEVGEISGVVQTPYGYHVVQRLE